MRTEAPRSTQRPPPPGLSAPPGWTLEPAWQRGRLVALHDRGTSSWTEVDGRGRATRVAVRVASPDQHAAPALALGERYAPRWYERSFWFDAADREVGATTGATHAELQGVEVELRGSRTSRSAMVTEYTRRGTTRVSIRKLKAVHTLTHQGARLGQRPAGDGEDAAPGGAGAPSNRARAKAVAAGPDSGQRSAEGFPWLAAEPTLNVAVTEAGDELDAEAALDGDPGGAQRPADAAGELMAALMPRPTKTPGRARSAPRARPADGARTPGAVR